VSSVAIGTRPLIGHCLALDLEIGKDSGRIHALAAIRSDRADEPLCAKQHGLHDAIRRVEHMAQDVSWLVGHNIIGFDLPHLRALAPDSPLLDMPVLDTLRLSPLAFPRNPYHRLVKHYKEAKLLRFPPSVPELDARLSLTLLEEEFEALRALRTSHPALLAAWHGLLAQRENDRGFAAFVAEVREAPAPTPGECAKAVTSCLDESACASALEALASKDSESPWPLVYALAWISVAGTNSVMPPWVRHEFPEAAELVRALRDRACGADGCAWCVEHHNPRRVLQRWFGFPAYRPVPACEDGAPMQEAIVLASMRGEHVLGILPTGTGKSVCYQVPALARYEHTGALTVVISPLVALMADQVHGLAARGISQCAALNGLLSMPERSEVLDRVRLGDTAILIVSPEQLRNRGFRRAVQQREIGGWVVDEAHCLSKWGHDFRTDYRYIGRFIRESAGEERIPPVLCLTATAKPDVIGDIANYFQHELKAPLRVFNGGANRENLDFQVQETTGPHKLRDLHVILQEHLPPEAAGGAIVYCATRRHTEAVAAHLQQLGWAAAYFHAGLRPESKKHTQQAFIEGTIKVIAATNAFGMGIDKPDVRVVIHVDIPGSLENYIQEAGRAGRDQESARCILLYCQEDVEQQFGLSALSRLPQHEIQAVLRAVRRLARRNRDAPVIATPGEILAGGDESVVRQDGDMEDTRVRTAIAWLERADLVRRDENRHEVYPSTLKIPSLEEARERLADTPQPYAGQLLALVKFLMDADSDEGVSTDELMGVTRLSSAGVTRALYDLQRRGILTEDSLLTALVHHGVASASQQRLEQASLLEEALIDKLMEFGAEMEKDSRAPLHLRAISQHLKEDGHQNALPVTLMRLLQGIAADGRSEGAQTGSLRLRKRDAEWVELTLQREWPSLRETARRRRAGAALLLRHLLECLPPGSRGTDLQVETTFGKLYEVLETDLELKPIKDAHRFVEHALLWMHEQEILRLGRGLTVFRAAMTLQVPQTNHRFTNHHYLDLQEHYREQVVQIHVMAEYARRGLRAAHDALHLARDYFTLSREDFLHRWFPKQLKVLEHQTTPASWNAIVEGLNRDQRAIVLDDRQQTNVLVLAGPGSGKTRVLVHRIAFLVRVQRERPRSILALAYNRHAAVEIRQRLHQLIGAEARFVTVLTCHALAMRLTGTSFATLQANEAAFREVVADAVALLKGRGIPEDEADAHREQLLAGFRWIFVDEYQDIQEEQYELIAALAGRTLNDPESKLSLFAVGDDDQNIYSFNGASVEYIRRFQSDYNAKPAYLTDNYRSTAHIIDAANQIIALAANRMKLEREIMVDEARRGEAPGGEWEQRDPLTRGRVHLLEAVSLSEQAARAMHELQRLASLDPHWDWAKAAVIAREWALLDAVQAHCEDHGIPAERADSGTLPFWRLREAQELCTWLRTRGLEPVATPEIGAWLAKQPDTRWWNLLREAAESYCLEFGEEGLPAAHFREWLVDCGSELSRNPRGLLLLSAHRAKGLEFDHVVLLDGGWQREKPDEDQDAQRRLYYVAMTRARKTLTLCRMGRSNPLLSMLAGSAAVATTGVSPFALSSKVSARRYRTLTASEVDLGYAGRQSPENAVHRNIRALQPGAPIQMQHIGGRWVMRDSHGHVVGRLASKFKLAQRQLIQRARVHAILTWRKQDGEEEYRETSRCMQWEVVIPELISTDAGQVVPKDAGRGKCAG